MQADLDRGDRRILDLIQEHGDLSAAEIAERLSMTASTCWRRVSRLEERRFTLIDSNGKKIRFVSHAVRTLGLMNVEPVQARVEALRPQRPFDTVLARAFAPLPQLLKAVAPLCGRETHVLAMKGKWPQGELDALPPLWRVADSHTLTVPGLEEARCLIGLRQAHEPEERSSP